MLFNNKLFNSIACLLSFTNLQLVIPGRTWILLYLGRTVYKRLWACLALYSHARCSDDYVIPSDLGSGVKTWIYGVEDVFHQGAYGALTSPIYNAVSAGCLISPELQHRHHPLPGRSTPGAHVSSGCVHLGWLDRDLGSTLV